MVLKVLGLTRYLSLAQPPWVHLELSGGNFCPGRERLQGSCMVMHGARPGADSYVRSDREQSLVAESKGREDIRLFFISVHDQHEP
jgi:hypothetical protein